jgi:Fibronectin type III domain
MKKSLPKVAISFATYNTNQLNAFTILVIACLKTNPLFPNLPVAIAALTALLTAYQDAMNAAAQGGPKDRAALREARDPLVAALRQNAAYIQSLGITNVSELLTSGYDVVNWSNAQSPLEAPVLLSLDNSVSGRLKVSLQAVSNARAYQAQFSADGGQTWLEGGIFSNSRTVLLVNLTPGTKYAVRVRAIGGSEHYSPWSAVLSIMCT